MRKITKILFSSFAIIGIIPLQWIVNNENKTTLDKHWASTPNEPNQKQISEIIPENTEIGNFIDEPNKNSILKYLENWSMVEETRLDIYQLEVASFDEKTAVIRAADWASDYTRGSTVVVKLVNNTKVSIKDIFGDEKINSPILNKIPTNKEEIVESIVKNNQELKNVKWSNLNIYYEKDGYFSLEAKELSIWYSNKTSLTVTTEIVCLENDPTLQDVGDTIVIKARLSELPPSSYNWQLDIPEESQTFFSTKYDYNNQAVIITAIKELDTIKISNFDVYFQIKGEHPYSKKSISNKINIKILKHSVDETFIVNKNEIIGLTEKGKKMQEIVIPEFSDLENPITSIGENVFFGNKTMKKITLSKNLLFVKKSAFEKCENLSEICLGNDQVHFDLYSLNTGATTKISIPFEFTKWASRGLANLSIKERTIPEFICKQKWNEKKDKGYFDYGAVELSTYGVGISDCSFSPSIKPKNIIEFSSFKKTKIVIFGEATQDLVYLQKKINETYFVTYVDSSIKKQWYQTATQVYWYHTWGFLQTTTTYYWLEYICYYCNVAHALSIDNTIKFPCYAERKLINPQIVFKPNGDPNEKSADLKDDYSSDREVCDLNWGEKFCDDLGNYISNPKIEHITWWHIIEISLFGKKTILSPPEHRSGNAKYQNGSPSVQGWRV